MPKKLHIVVKIDGKDIDAIDKRDSVMLAEHAIRSGKKAVIFIDGKEDKELNEQISKVFQSIPSSVIVELRITSSDLSDLAKKASDLPVSEVLERMDTLRSTLQEMYDKLNKDIGTKTDEIAFAS